MEQAPAHRIAAAAGVAVEKFVSGSGAQEVAVLACLDCAEEWHAAGAFVATDPGHEFWPDPVFVADEGQECPTCGYHDWGWIRRATDSEANT